MLVPPPQTSGIQTWHDKFIITSNIRSSASNRSSSGTVNNLILARSQNELMGAFTEWGSRMNGTCCLYKGHPGTKADTLNRWTNSERKKCFKFFKSRFCILQRKCRAGHPSHHLSQRVTDEATNDTWHDVQNFLNYYSLLGDMKRMEVDLQEGWVRVSAFPR